MENSGKLTDLPDLNLHLRQVYDAAVEYFQWEADLADPDPLLRTNDSQRPDQPEPLAILNYLQNFKTTYWPGGLADQPYILTLELQECINAQNAIQRILIENAERQAEWQRRDRRNSQGA